MHNAEAGEAQLAAVLRSQSSCICYHVIYLQMSSHSHIAEPKSWRDTPYSFHQQHTWHLETSQGPPMGWRSHKRRAKGKWGYSKSFQCTGDSSTLNVKKSLQSVWMNVNVKTAPCCTLPACDLKSTHLSINSDPQFGVWGSLADITILVRHNSWSLQLLEL